ncbi:MAG: hypothetical protein WCW35_02540 [Bacteroidota bacterium]
MNAATKVDFSLLKQIAVVLLVTGGLGFYPVTQYTAGHIAEGIAAGVVLSVVNALLGYGVIQFSLNRSYTIFMQIVLGGIVVRLFVMVGLLLAAVALFKFHAVSLIGSLFVMYMVFLTLEVLYIHKKIQH